MRSVEFADNVEASADHLKKIDDVLLDFVHPGGGPRVSQKHADRGKMAIRERIHVLVDSASPFLELSALAGLHESAPCAGIVTGVGLAHGCPVIVVAKTRRLKAGPTSRPLSKSI